VGESTAEKIKKSDWSIEDLETPPEDMSVQEEIYLPVNQKVEVSYREIAKALDKSIQRRRCCYGNFISNSSRISSRHLQYRYLSCRWWFYVEDWTKEFLKKQTYLFTLQKILYEQ
jgi:hypothetical protein